MTKTQKNIRPLPHGDGCAFISLQTCISRMHAWLLSVLSCLQNNGCSSKQKNGCCNETGVSGSGS